MQRPTRVIYIVLMKARGAKDRVRAKSRPGHLFLIFRCRFGNSPIREPLGYLEYEEADMQSGHG